MGNGDFPGEDYEGVDDFIYRMEVGFERIAARYLDVEKRKKAKIACLVSYLSDDAYKWWCWLETSKKNTWETAIASLREEYGRMDTLELQKAYIRLRTGYLQQGNSSCIEYLKLADTLYRTFKRGSSTEQAVKYSQEMSQWFIFGIADSTTSWMVHKLLDTYPRTYEGVREAFIEVTMGLHHTSPVIENEKPIIEIKEPEEPAEIIESIECVQNSGSIKIEEPEEPEELVIENNELVENVTPKEHTEIEKPMEEPTEAIRFSESTEPAQDIKPATIEEPIVEIEEIIENAEPVKPPENNEIDKPVIENEEPGVPVKDRDDRESE